MTAYKRYGAYIGITLAIILIGIISARQQAQINALVEERDFFAQQYNHQRSITIQWEQRNQRLTDYNDNLSQRYDELANGSYCINSIEDWEDAE